MRPFSSSVLGIREIWLALTPRLRLNSLNRKFGVDQAEPLQAVDFRNRHDARIINCYLKRLQIECLNLLSGIPILNFTLLCWIHHS